MSKSPAQEKMSAARTARPYVFDNPQTGTAIEVNPVDAAILGRHDPGDSPTSAPMNAAANTAVKTIVNGVVDGQPVGEPGTIHTRAKGARMQISETMNAEFNDQITMELQAAHNYLAMGAWLESAGFSGMSTWMRAQSTEETSHAMKFYQFVLDRGGRVVLGSLAAPPADFDSVAAVFEAALAQEREVSAAINNLYAQATEDRDFASVPLLDWFVTEQIEEEATFSQILDDLTLAEGGPQAMLFLDREFGGRGTGE